MGKDVTVTDFSFCPCFRVVIRVFVERTVTEIGSDLSRRTTHSASVARASAQPEQEQLSLVVRVLYGAWLPGVARWIIPTKRYAVCISDE